MQKIKNGTWLEYLDYISIKNYLTGSIASKGCQIGKNVSLEQKVKDVNLTNYLIGVKVFLTEYTKKFAYPDAIIDYYKDVRNDDEKLSEFKHMIESYADWLKNDKKLSDSTAANYQAHVRGFLRWNNVILKFRNYKPKSEKSKL